MSLDKTIQTMIEQELKLALGPVFEQLRALQKQVAKTAGQPRHNAAQQKRACALMGCKRPARSKGYCSAHYQKYRTLANQGRLPKDWVENAKPHSLKNVELPRGRLAGS
jgi:hypothetical protein